MPLATGVRILRTIADLLLAEEAKPFPALGEPKPVFIGARQAVPLPRCAPEEAGFESRMLEDFYRAMAALDDTCVHSLLVARSGRVVSEGHFAPYRGDVWHVTHSLAKSFTGTAVGIAIHEGLFSLEDPVVKFFPDKLGRFSARRMGDVTVGHLLTMSSGIQFNEISQTVDADWLHGIFAGTPNFAPGTRFQYNSMNSYLLSALVQRTSGESVLEYLTPRLFQPMGFGPLAWEKSPEGIDKGGWGMYILPEDMLKFGQLYLNRGRWEADGETRQLVPEEWVEEATKTQITGAHGEQYGYHFWVEGDAGDFLMNGMFGQNILVMPRLDTVVAITAGSPYANSEASANRLLREWWGGMQNPTTALPANPAGVRSLRSSLARLRLCEAVPVVQRHTVPTHPRTRAQRWQSMRREVMPATDPALHEFTGKTWRFEKNRAGLLPFILQVMDNNFSGGVQGLHLQPDGPDGLLLLWEEGDGTACLPLGPVGNSTEYMATLGRERFLTSGSWQLAYNEDGEPVLKIQIALLEHSSTRSMKLLCRNGKLLLRMDETPALLVAINAVIDQSAGAIGSAKNERPGAANILETAYMDSRIHKLCTPELEGAPQ